MGNGEEAEGEGGVIVIRIFYVRKGILLSIKNDLK